RESRGRRSAPTRCARARPDRHLLRFLQGASRPLRRHRMGGAGADCHRLGEGERLQCPGRRRLPARLRLVSERPRRDPVGRACGGPGWAALAVTAPSRGRAPPGSFSVAAPRLGCHPRAGAYRVLRWDEAAATITASLDVDNGPAAVADPRIDPDKPPPFTPLI